MKRLFLLIAFIAVASTLKAQVPGGGASSVVGKISGTVIDSLTKKPLDYATVTLFRNTGKVPLNGTLTDDKGSFKLNNIAPGTYKITVSFIGYPTKTITGVTTTPEKPDNNMGNVVVAPGASALKDVTVTGQAAIIENRVDKVVYNAEKDATVSGGNAGDVLRKVPMVSVDQDGNVSLRGSQGVKVLINGKPSGSMAGSVGDAMKMIPADQIKTVEVITSPSAKYDAEGTAGIINIITKKKGVSGVSGSISGGVGTRQNNGNANLNINQNRLSISGNAGGNLTWPQTSKMQFNSSDPSKQLNRSQVGTTETKRFAGVGSGNASYDFNNFNSISTGIRFNQGQFSTNGSNTNISTLAGTTTAFSLQNENKTEFKGFDWNADYTHKFKKEGEELTLAGQWSHAKNENNFSSSYSPLASPNSNQIGSNDAKNDEYTAQLDYTLPVNKTVKLETGGKSISRKINSLYDVTQQSSTSSPYVPNPAASNNYDYNQDVYSGYAVLSLQVKNVGFQFGGRVENTQISGEGSSNSFKPFSNSYTNFIPSFAVSRTFKGNNTLRLSYSKRIQRPSLQYLNPYRNISNSYYHSQGDPSLSPEIAQSVELNFSTFIKSSVINASLYYRHTDDIIESFVTTENYENKLVTLTTFRNTGTNNSVGTSLFGQVMPVKNLTMRSSINLYSYKTAATAALQSQAGNNKTYLMYNVFASGSYTLPKGFVAESFLIFNAPRRTFQAKNPSFSMWVMSFNKEILQKKGKIGLNVIDPFNEDKNFNSETVSGSLTQNTKFAMPFRSVGVNFSWTFGKMNFNAQPKKKRGVNNDDLKQGDSQGGQGTQGNQ